MKHERQVLIAGWDQEALKQSAVSVVGAGALGSSLGITLARLGVGRILLIDPDVLEEHNLENQQYDNADLGKPKVLALKERIEKIDNTIEVQAVVARLHHYVGPLFGPWIFGCVDNPAARHQLNFIAVSGNKTYIDGGIDAHRGVVKTIRSKSTACLGCHPLMPAVARRGSCSTSPIPSTFVIASLTANLMAAQFLKLLRNEPWNSHLALDLRDLTLASRDFKPAASCEMCGDGQ